MQQQKAFWKTSLTEQRVLLPGQLEPVEKRVSKPGKFSTTDSFLIDNTAHLARDLMGETVQTETTSPKTILQWTKINGEDIYIVFLLCFWPVRKLGVNHQSIAWHHAAWPLVLLLVVKVVYEGDHGNHRDHDGDPG